MIRQRSLRRLISGLLRDQSIHLVLFDVGASGAPPPAWLPLIGEAIYIGFDPDRRETSADASSPFFKSFVVNEAVTHDPSSATVQFYLTRSPYCSSTLLPLAESLSNYAFSDLFTVERTTSVPAVTAGAVLARLGLNGVDWFKTDSQGTDLRLFSSLPEDVRGRVLAVDLEPGLIDAYEGEDLFTHAHPVLQREGFWLAQCRVQGSSRLKTQTRQWLRDHYPSLNDEAIRSSTAMAPGWVELRYFRTLESLARSEASPREYLLLWAFAMLDGHFGFGLDVALAYGERFGEDAVVVRLRTIAVAQMRRRGYRGLPRRVWNAMSPGMRRHVRTALLRFRAAR